VVALEGTNFASRVSGGLLRAAGLGGLVCASVDAYINLAVDLATHPGKVEQVRRHLQQKRQRLPVFDAATRTRQLESAYTAMHSRRVKDLPPDHIRVGVQRPPSPVGQPASPATKTEQGLASA